MGAAEYFSKVVDPRVVGRCKHKLSDTLDGLELSRAVVFIDAMEPQTAIAKQIISFGADYILSLKGNHKHFFKDIQDSFTCKKYKRHRYESLEKNHGSIEKRVYTILYASEVFCEREGDNFSEKKTNYL